MDSWQKFTECLWLSFLGEAFTDWLYLPTSRGRRYLYSEEMEWLQDGKKQAFSVVHVTNDGRFVNPWSGSHKKQFSDVCKTLLWLCNPWLSDNSGIPAAEDELNETLPVKHPVFTGITTQTAQCTWIGHATVLLRLEGITILCDPVFSERCSPLINWGPKRYRPVPCFVNELPPVDVVLLSHSHYDHLDETSIHCLATRFPRIQWLVPLGLCKFLHEWGCEDVTELNWWHQVSSHVNNRMRFVLTPSQHWCARGFCDHNRFLRYLWGSWTIIGQERSVWFGGDTGYCPAFKEIHSLFGPITLALIPIGAYEPDWFVAHQHVTPEEAVKIHRDLGANISIGIHWGTFKLTYEHYLEPRHRLQAAMQSAGLPESSFICISHGETIEF